MSLRVGHPHGIDTLSLAVRDARREVAVANDDRPLGQPALDERLPLVAVRDVQQLQDIRRVLTAAVQRVVNLLADRGLVGGKVEQLRRATTRFDKGAQALGLRLLAALIEPFEGNQKTRHASSGFQRKQIVERLPPPNERW